MRVLITEAVNAPLEPLESLEVLERDGLWRDPAALFEAVAGADALVVRNATRVDARLLAAARRLRVVGRLGAGLDNLEFEALAARGIAVVHGGGLNARAVAEYAIGACFALARSLPRSDREIRSGGWRRHVGLELAGETLGVVGLGATGAATARLGLAVGLRVLGHDPHLPAPDGVEPTDLDTLLRRSRFVSLHVPLLDATRGLIGRPELDLMPDGAYLINAARGGVVDEPALLEALERGRLGGAALDVRAKEPPSEADPFRGRDDVLLTPHLAGLTRQSQSAIARHVLTGVRDVLRRVSSTGRGERSASPMPSEQEV